MPPESEGRWSHEVFCHQPHFLSGVYILERRGKEVAAIVSLEDVALLQAIEDREEIKVARQAISELKQTRQKPLSLDEIKEQLEL